MAHTLQCRTDTKCSKQWLQNSIAGAIFIALLQPLVTCTFIAFLILPGTSWGGWGYAILPEYNTLVYLPGHCWDGQRSVRSTDDSQ